MTAHEAVMACADDPTAEVTYGCRRKRPPALKARRDSDAQSRGSTVSGDPPLLAFQAITRSRMRDLFAMPWAGGRAVSFAG